MGGGVSGVTVSGLLEITGLISLRILGTPIVVLRRNDLGM
jgi:hypothetical protein